MTSQGSEELVSVAAALCGPSPDHSLGSNNRPASGSHRPCFHPGFGTIAVEVTGKQGVT